MKTKQILNTKYGNNWSLNYNMLKTELSTISDFHSIEDIFKKHLDNPHIPCPLASYIFFHSGISSRMVKAFALAWLH